MSWPPPNCFNIGDMVIVTDGAHKTHPALIIELDKYSQRMGGWARVSGWNETSGLWSAWFPNDRIIHDIHAT